MFKMCLFFLAEWHILLQPISSREAAGCVITWLISCHATHREWEWDGGSAAGVWSDGTAGALPLQTSDSTGLVPSRTSPIYLRARRRVHAYRTHAPSPKALVTFPAQCGIKPQTYQVTSNGSSQLGSEQMNVQCDSNIDTTTKSLLKP